MKAYADTSFLVKLIAHEAGSEEAIAEFRRLDCPRLPFLPLHALEARNAIRQRVFHRRRSAADRERAAIARERDAALARLERWLQHGWLVEVAAGFDAAFAQALDLSNRHTERSGCRAFDLLHVALALQLECETFWTADEVQAGAARAEGLEVVRIALA